jgi:hypothetical protein
MRRYLVKVHCCGVRWIVYVAAVESWTLVKDKKAIRPAAAQMISARTNVPRDSFGMDLAEGRVFTTVDEFTATALFAQNWEHTPSCAPIGAS